MCSSEESQGVSHGDLNEEGSVLLVIVCIELKSNAGNGTQDILQTVTVSRTGDVSWIRKKTKHDKEIFRRKKQNRYKTWTDWQ